ncbi:hypothetical protein LguiA_032752 [Lonicera macranthoides]
MERQKFGFAVIFSVIIIFGLASFAMCVAAEFKRSKKEDLRLDGKWCYLPGSGAFGCGSAALVLLFIAQIIGNLILCRKCCSGGERSSCKAKNQTIPIIFISLSWISFGTAVILIGAATSMNGRQAFGKGWLDGECYIVKDGVFIGSGILVLITLSSTLVSGILELRKSQVEQGQKVHHAQVE